jgi:hypothetical protein
MKKLTVLALLAALLLALAGCEGDGEADTENGETETAENGEAAFASAENLVDAFVVAANAQDKETFYGLFYDEGTADAVWERVTEYDLRFSPGYHIEESGFGPHVIFDSARWEGFGVYEQQLYVSDDPALGPGWIINGQDYAFVTEEEETETEEVETEETEP